MWPGLVAELSGQRDADQALAMLARTDTFVAASPVDPDSYEYHPIVRDLLRAQLRREAPHRVRQLHRKAARWLADDGRTTDAIAHAAAAGDWEHAVALPIADFGMVRLTMDRRPGGLAELFAGMPPDVAGPEAAVVQAALALCRSDPDMCAKHLLRATELVDTGPAERGAALRLAVAVIEIGYARIRGDVKAAAGAASTAQTLVAEMTAGGRAVPADLRALVLLEEGRALLRSGELDAAAGALAGALALADSSGTERVRQDCLGHLALVEVLRGHLRRAGELGRRAGPVTADRAAATDVALAWVHAEECDLKSAREHADRAAAEAESDPVSAGLLAIVRARLLRARGDTAGAATDIGRVRDHAPAVGMPEWLLERLAAVHATLLVTSGTPESAAAALADAGGSGSEQSALALALVRFATGATDDALEQVSRVLAHATAADVRVDGLLLAAAGELARGRIEPARTALRRALRLAQPEKLRRPLVDAPPGLRRFLRQERELTEHHTWLGAAIAGGPAVRPNGGSGAVADGGATIVETLTVKETEVLRHLAALASTEEIGRKMFVSVNTVKTHIRGLLRKLAASRRNEAVRRAKDLGLI
jgi:LuxR family maltose regulon positive regulatory protein